ncbi:unnamed protein product [Didymodactylos carnosus]|uniref:TIR domain-containing protein n=1 Tax=Didymodactylos carnosus TaxID=1234261 RepID=A0A8S2DC65_9BILA|nr:unnamed protein product [Didymodactylos carnosus]CAF3676414.1 unnamed protein product [Didymodactylos carnosus]
MTLNKVIGTRVETITNNAQNLTNDQVVLIFNDFLSEVTKQYEECEVDDCLETIEYILDVILKIPIKQLISESIISHALFPFFRDITIRILKKWRSECLRLNIRETNIFEKIIQLFSSLIDDTDVITKLLTNEELFAEVKLQMEDSWNNKLNVNDDPNITNLGLFCVHTLKNTGLFDNNKNISLLIGHITNCIKSLDYISALKKLQLEPNILSHTDKFLLYTCFEYFPKRCPPDSKQHIVIDLCSAMLERYEYTLEHLLSSNVEFSKHSVIISLEYILNIFYLLLDAEVPNTFRKHAKIVDHLLTILSNKTLFDYLQLRPDDNNNYFNTPSTTTLMLSAIKTFDAASSNPDLLPIIKDKQKTKLFLKLATVSHEEIKIYANNIMANTISEHELEYMGNAQEMTSMYIDKLKQISSNPKEASKSLSGLKALVQHDHIKDELIRQDGLSLLIKYACNDYSIETQRDALDILWTTAFNDDAAAALKHDEKFMTYVKSLLTSNDPKLKKTAEGIIWKLEKEKEFKEKKAKLSGTNETDNASDEEEPTKVEYDIMISYSWADQDLCAKIHEGLLAKSFRVWLDKNEMHGSTIEAMANAVDSSEFILMCMSETYKRSTNCKSEAEYAFSRKRRIIPIIMREKYRPDGWLGFIAGSRMYIDFGEFDVQTGLEKLINEIELNRVKPKQKPPPPRNVSSDDLQLVQKSSGNADQVQTVQPKYVVKFDTHNISIESWSEDDVTDFLHENKLEIMLPFCQQITGEELQFMYKMCESNPNSMYLSLKAELYKTKNKVLPIATYLKFVNHLKQCVYESN